MLIFLFHLIATFKWMSSCVIFRVTKAEAQSNSTDVADTDNDHALNQKWANHCITNTSNKILKSYNLGKQKQSNVRKYKHYRNLHAATVTALNKTDRTRMQDSKFWHKDTFFFSWIADSNPQRCRSSVLQKVLIRGPTKARNWRWENGTLNLFFSPIMPSSRNRASSFFLFKQLQSDSRRHVAGPLHLESFHELESWSLDFILFSFKLRILIL